MGLQTHFNAFHQKIKLDRNDDAYKKARARDDSIKSDVKDSFSDAGYPVIRDFIQGSLSTFTGVIPVGGDFDIDRALVIDADQAPENPVTPKKDVLGVLEARHFKNAKIKKPCVTADYASDDVHIDFVVYRLSGDQHELAVGKEHSDEDHREWSASDPDGLINWVNNSDMFVSDDASACIAQFRRLVRYLKRWRDVQFSADVARKVFSIGLTVMVKSQFRYSFSAEGASQDLTALRSTVEAILGGGYFSVEGDNYRVRVDLPVQPWRDIFHGSSLDTGTQLFNKLTRLKDRLKDVADLSDEREQCKILNELFGDDFVVPDPPKGQKASKAKYASAGVVPHSQGA